MRETRPVTMNIGTLGRSSPTPVPDAPRGEPKQSTPHRVRALPVTTDVALAALVRVSVPTCDVRKWVNTLDGLVREIADQLAAAQARAEQAEALLNAPELHDFARGVVLEAAHQRVRWGAEHDAGKAPLDWFWLIGYLAQKAATSALAGDTDKALHHTISTAAALANWHARLLGASTAMRPGIGPGNAVYDALTPSPTTEAAE